MTTTKIFTKDDVEDIADWLIRMGNGKLWWLFYGEVGAGKTTLIKKIVEKMGMLVESNSPTFSIINEYESDAKILYHMDLYRMRNWNESEEIGLTTYLFSGHICLIEWPQLLEDNLNESLPTMRIYLEYLSPSERKIEIV